MALIFPYKKGGSDGTTCMPLVSFLLLRPPPVEFKMVQDLFEKSWFLIFFCLFSFPLFSFRSPVKFHPTVSLNHCSLQVDSVPITRFSASPLSAVNLFTVSTF